MRAGESTSASAPAPSHIRLVPTTALVVTVAVVLLPVALSELLLGDVAVRALAVGTALLAIMAVVDAALALGRAGDVAVRMAPLTRLALGRTAAIEMELRAAAEQNTGRIRVAIAPARRLGIAETESDVTLNGGGAVVRVMWRGCPRGRGVFRLDTLFIGRRSPAGLWRVQWRVPLDGEVRVYPNMLGESRRLAALFLRRPLQGWRVARQVGRGRDFEKLREYLPGDGFDEIHWKATAKRRHPVTKVFQVERTQEVYAIVDASRLSGRSANGSDVAAGVGEGVDDTLLERQINAALALAVASERQGDLFGLVTYADRPRGFVRAKGGPAHFQACRETMVSLRAESVSPDFREVCAFLRSRLTKRALLIFFASLDDPALAETFVDAVALVARRHLVVVASPLPRDAAPLFSGISPGSTDEIYQRLGGHIRWQGLQDLGAMLHRHGVRLALLERDELAAGTVSHYMSLKQRQAI